MCKEPGLVQAKAPGYYYCCVITYDTTPERNGDPGAYSFHLMRATSLDGRWLRIESRRDMFLSEAEAAFGEPCGQPCPHLRVRRVRDGTGITERNRRIGACGESGAGPQQRDARPRLPRGPALAREGGLAGRELDPALAGLLVQMNAEIISGMATVLMVAAVAELEPLMAEKIAHAMMVVIASPPR